MGYKLAKKDYGALLTKVELEADGVTEKVLNAWAFNDHVGLSISEGGSSAGAMLSIKAGWMQIEIPLAELEVEEVVPPAGDALAAMEAVGAVFVLD
jgi:hypothetical protein